MFNTCTEVPANWPQPGGPVSATAKLRSSPEDFVVDEELGFEPGGEGEHALLQIRKQGCNTAWVARQLAGLAGIRVREVSYCGLKDRDAITSQWFSVWLPGKPDPDWKQLNDDQIEVLRFARHRRKLRRGFHRSNRFGIRLRELKGNREQLQQQLETLRDEGVVNYFGPQRFGHGSGNIEAALGLFRGTNKCRDRHLRGLYLSAARSLLFNRIAAARVADGSWNRALAGEVLMLDGTRSIFDIEQPDDDITSRVISGDLHPTAPLWGMGESRATAEALAVEQRGMQGCDEIQRGLEAIGMKQERRALRLRPQGLSWEFEADDVLRLEFSLPTGGYATTVVAALADTTA
jgi:tRNA pseudouridine13 synthase